MTPPADRRGAREFAVAIAVAQACALIRYVVLARILGPAELGWAVMIVLIGQFFDSVTDSGSDRFLIGDPQGNEPEAQRFVQLMALVRGLFISSTLLFLAVPIAQIMNAPSIVPGLHLLALAPLLSGLIHLDLRRVQRQHDFRIEGRATLLAEIVSLTVTAAAAFLTRSYLAIVFGLIARAIVLVLVSHAMAQRKFSIRPSRLFAKKLAVFGLPLMVNGLVLFFGSQGDRLIISNLLGAAELGRYSAVMLLIFYPIMVSQRYVAGLYLPQLVRANPSRTQAAGELGGLVVVIASAAVVSFGVLAPFIVPILFGSRFRLDFEIVALIGVLNAARFMKVWPINVLLADGRSHGVLITNVVRLVAIPLTIAAIRWEHSLLAILMAFTIGELISMAVGIYLASKALPGSTRIFGVRMLLFLAVSVVLLVGSVSAQVHSVVSGAFAALIMAALLAVLWTRERPAVHTLIGALPLERLYRRKPSLTYPVSSDALS